MVTSNGSKSISFRSFNHLFNFPTDDPIFEILLIRDCLALLSQQYPLSSLLGLLTKSDLHLRGAFLDERSGIGADRDHIETLIQTLLGNLAR